VATVTKVGTGGLLARALGWSRPDALAMGWLVNSRGAVELAMAVILLGSGVFDAAQFTLVAAVGLVTTMLAPAGAKGAWTRDPTARREFFLRAPRFRPAGEPGPLVPPPRVPPVGLTSSGPPVIPSNTTAEGGGRHIPSPRPPAPGGGPQGPWHPPPRRLPPQRERPGGPRRPPGAAYIYRPGGGLTARLDRGVRRPLIHQNRLRGGDSQGRPRGRAVARRALLKLCSVGSRAPRRAFGGRL